MKNGFWPFLTKKRTIRTIGFQLLLTSISAIVINYVTNPSNDVEHRLIWIIFLLIVMLISFVVLAYIVFTDIAEDLNKNRMNWFRTDSVKKMNEQLEHLDRFHSNESYFKLMLSHFRIVTEHNKFNKISDSHNTFWSLRALTMWDYFIYVFRAIIRELIEGDEYLTISVIDFWTKDKPATEIENEQVDITAMDRKNLFETNYLQCSIGNVLSKRVILVDENRIKRGKDKINQASVSESDQADIKYYTNFKEIVFKYSDKNFPHSEKFINLFYLTNESEYSELLKEDIPFALIRRANYSNKLIISTYIPDLHKPQNDNDPNLKWRSGQIAKVGFYICSDDQNKYWSRMYSKFNSIYNNDKRAEQKRRGKIISPIELHDMIIAKTY